MNGNETTRPVPGSTIAAAQARLEARRASERRSQGEPAPEPDRHLAALEGGAQRSSELEPEKADRRRADPYDTLVPEGLYRVVYDTSTKKRGWGRQQWVVKFMIAEEGEHFGLPIYFFMTRIPRDKRPTPGWTIVTAFAVGTGRKPPKDLWRLSPAQFLSGCTFRARVVTVKADANQVERPEALHYSRVKALTERLSGSPPWLRKVPERARGGAPS